MLNRSAIEYEAPWFATMRRLASVRALPGGGRGVMVARDPSKVEARVRFPPPAPALFGYQTTFNAEDTESTEV